MDVPAAQRQRRRLEVKLVAAEAVEVLV